jgi:chaperone modulatory protein CbpM
MRTGSSQPTRSQSTPIGAIITIPPRLQVHLTADELATAAGISRAMVTRLVDLGLIEPTAPGSSKFTADTAARLRRMLRLRTDLGVNLVGAAVIVDLLARFRDVEEKLAHLRGAH